VNPPEEAVVPESQESTTTAEPEAEKGESAPSVKEEASSKETVTVQDHHQASREKAVYTQKSVLEEFRDLQEAPSPKSLTALFDQEPLVGFKQEPRIILSDGKSTVNVTFIAFAYGKDRPNVSVRHARLISLKKDPENTNTWRARIRPDKGVNSAALTVVQKKIVMIFPLTIAAQRKIGLGRSGHVTEADFSAFLRERGTRAKPKYDLNNDGKRDYVDDYIFTANYLLLKTKGETKRQVRRRR
jgi:hypothetical protein